jgi:TPR repeat protein
MQQQALWTRLLVKYPQLTFCKGMTQRFLIGGSKEKLAQQLSQRVGSYVNPPYAYSASNNMMLIIIQRVYSKQMAAVRDDAAKYGEEQCAAGQCAEALIPLQRAIDFGNTTSLALMAWLLIFGRKGVAENQQRAFELAEEGVRLGCYHCQGVLAFCYFFGHGCKKNQAQSLALAHKSSGLGSRYGQLTLGWFHFCGVGFATDNAQAVAFYQQAAAQDLDGAKYMMGEMYCYGWGVAFDKAEALRWYQLAAAQGHPEALFKVAFCHERGWGVPESRTQAFRLYKLAKEAGCLC